MWIRTSKDGLKKMFIREIMDEPVVFSGNGKAQVKKEVGEALIERFPDDFTALEEEVTVVEEEWTDSLEEEE